MKKFLIFFTVVFFSACSTTTPKVTKHEKNHKVQQNISVAKNKQKTSKKQEL